MKPLVVLLHGLARGQGSMRRLGTYLRAEGFETIARTYPSRRHSIEYLAREVADWIVERADGRPVHAVTHSMGGVIVRHLHDPRIRWERIVMLAPPNRGSRLAAGLVRNPVFRWFYGPAGVELADGSLWPSPPAPFGVIAGTRAVALSNVTSWTVGRRFARETANDGTVAVDETKLDGMSAFAEVDATHTWIMNDPTTCLLVARYLHEGSFTPPISPPPA
ncbi:MAG TPA: alpha/beta fold hydrolase [Kofleriaceae bacterium]|jgi:pimeloyl-ACP methyl ester carboxylesterase|nr:alpha/beta fold hydrolase [Kofleriaceae bacterium]